MLKYSSELLKKSFPLFLCFSLLYLYFLLFVIPWAVCNIFRIFIIKAFIFIYLLFPLSWAAFTKFYLIIHHTTWLNFPKRILFLLLFMTSVGLWVVLSKFDLLQKELFLYWRGVVMFIIFFSNHVPIKHAWHGAFILFLLNFTRLG